MRTLRYVHQHLAHRILCLQACIAVSQATGTVRLGTWRQFAYDYAFGLEAQQQDVFAACVSPLVDSFLEGYNATVLAYGPTGSGKTYTMGMGSVLHSMAEHHGVIPRVIRSDCCCMLACNAVTTQPALKHTKVHP